MNGTRPARPPPAPKRGAGNDRFTPAWWLPGPHLQTLWPVLFRRRAPVHARRERLELPDGDFLDLLWNDAGDGPLVLVLHGLEGSVQSHYASGLLAALSRGGYRFVFMHFRGCSGRPNRLPRGYHSGDTGDLGRVIDHIEARTGAPPAAAVGFSLGGNVLLKALGEQGKDSVLRSAVAVSVPFLLNDCAERLNHGLSRLYRNHLLHRLRFSYRTKFRQIPSPLDVDVERLLTFREFDDRVTAPLHGFGGVDHYYGSASSRQYIPRITVPTLIIHAADDPFMWPRTVPEPGELPSQVQLELSRHGGHVGFVAGRFPWRPVYWLEQRVMRHLEETLMRDTAR